MVCETGEGRKKVENGLQGVGVFKGGPASEGGAARHSPAGGARALGPTLIFFSMARAICKASGPVQHIFNQVTATDTLMGFAGTIEMLPSPQACLDIPILLVKCIQAEDFPIGFEVLSAYDSRLCLEY